MNGSRWRDEKRDLSYEILAYMSEHPNAQDTLEGIMQWWLLEREIKYWTVEVQAALAKLVSEGFVLQRKGKDQRIHYRLNKRKAHQIQSVLTEQSKSGKT